MKRRALMLLLMIAVLLLGIGNATADDGFVLRSSVVPEEAWVGQRVGLRIDVLSADGWAQVINVGEVEVEGGYVVRTQSQGTRLNETIRGTAYSGQRYELLIFCQQPGRVEIPPLPLTVAVKQWGVGQSEARDELTTPATSFVCKVPPGAEGVRGLISTSRLEAHQTWSSEPQEVAPGDAITRTVTLTAVDVPGMAFPPMQRPEIAGVAVYAGQSSVGDQAGRGSLRGERVETVTYVFERPGEVALPSIVLTWWDLDAEALRRVELPGMSLVVTGESAPEVATDTVAAPTLTWRERVSTKALIAAALALVLGIWVGRLAIRHIRARRRRRRVSEAACFKQVRTALRGGDPVMVSSAVMRWLDRLDAGTRPARLDAFLKRYGSDESRQLATELAHCLGSGTSLRDSRRWCRGLEEARRQAFRDRRHAQRAASILPPLNGGSDSPTV